MKLARIVARAPDGVSLVETTVPAAPAYALVDEPTFSKVFGIRVINVFPCKDREQADWVVRYGRANPLLKRPRVTTQKPEPGDDRVLVVFSEVDAEAWASYGRDTEHLAPVTPQNPLP